MNAETNKSDIHRNHQAGQIAIMDSVKTNETIELTDLEPIGEVVGGPFTGSITLSTSATIGASSLAGLDSEVLTAGGGRQR